MAHVIEPRVQSNFKSYLVFYLGDNHRDVVTRSAQLSGSLSDLEFDVRFNPDIYSEGVTHADPNGARFQKEKKLVKDAARFVVVNQIPTLVSGICISDKIMGKEIRSS